MMGSLIHNMGLEPHLCNTQFAIREVQDDNSFKHKLIIATSISLYTKGTPKIRAVQGVLTFGVQVERLGTEAWQKVQATLQVQARCTDPKKKSPVVTIALI